MSLFGDLKKIFFGAKAVSKSAADKAVDAGKDAGGKLFDQADELFDKAKDSAGGLSETMMEKGGDLFDKAKDFAEDAGSKVADSELVNKAKNAAENVGEKILGSDVFDKTKNVAEDLGGSIIEKTSGVVDKAKGLAEDVGSKILGSDALDKTKNVAEDLGGTIIEKGGDVTDKAADLAENIGSNVLETGAKAGDKFKNVAENLGGTILATGGTFFDKAKDFAEDAGSKIKDKTNELVEKAEAEAKKEYDMDATVKKAKKMESDLQDKVADSSPKMGYDNDSSLLDGHDDFFAKAERFAEGDYHNEGAHKKTTPDVTAENDDILELKDLNNDTKLIGKSPKDSSTTKEPFKGDIHGFNDADGDGDPLIDDAIIDEDDPKEE